LSSIFFATSLELKGWLGFNLILLFLIAPIIFSNCLERLIGFVTLSWIGVVGTPYISDEILKNSFVPQALSNEEFFLISSAFIFSQESY